MNPAAANSVARSFLRTLARRAGPASASSISGGAACATRNVAAFTSMTSPVTATASDLSYLSVTSSGVPRRSYSSTSTLFLPAAHTGEEILAHFGNRASSFQGIDIAGAMESLANADAVCFDVDSTVIDEEGIVSVVITHHCIVFVVGICLSSKKPELVGPSWPRSMLFTSAPPCVLGRGEQ
jgi:hypothetical protein